jgi:hypothetical protein
MKRDMDLARKILLEVEAYTEIDGWVPLEIEGYSSTEINYHIKLLAQAGLVEAEDASTLGGSSFYVSSLTWEGHEFLDAARDSSRWQKAKDLVAQKGGALTFEILKQVLMEIAKNNIFPLLPP